MKHDEALVRSMTPADRAILEEWAVREGPLAEACRAALREIDANRDIVDIAAMTDEQLEAVIAESCAAWHGREQGHKQEWKREFRRGLPAAQADALDEAEFRVEARELTKLLEGGAENVLAKGLCPIEANYAAMTDEQLDGVVQGANREWCARRKHGGAPAGGPPGVECPECGGIGWHYGTEDRDCEDCPVCNGSGIRQ